MTNIIITMAGLGSRFREAGYVVPKYMIDVNDKTLFQWSLESIASYKAGIHVFICLQMDNASAFIESQCTKLGIEHFTIIELAALTSGQAETAMLGAEHVPENEPVAIFNIDTHVASGLKYYNGAADGFIPCFGALGDHWSFVRMDVGGSRALEVREKQRISRHATVGFYWFRSAGLYKKLYETYYCKVGSSNFERGEAYIAPMYNQLIHSGGLVEIEDYDLKDIIPLGTPLEVDAFRALK